MYWLSDLCLSSRCDEFSDMSAPGLGSVSIPPLGIIPVTPLREVGQEFVLGGGSGTSRSSEREDRGFLNLDRGVFMVLGVRLDVGRICSVEGVGGGAIVRGLSP